MSDPKVCFWHNEIPECLELEQVQVPTQGFLTNSQSVMQAVKDVDGFKTVICDKERHCWLFKSNPENVQEGLLNLFGSNYWDNPDIEMRVDYKYSAIYFVTPDGRNFGYDGTVQYMGHGVDLLFKRETALVELKEYLASRLKDRLKTSVPENNKPNKKEFTKQREERTVSTNPFEFFHRTNIEPYQSIGPDKIFSSSDDISLRFFSWSASIMDPRLNECLKSTEQILSIDSQGYYVDSNYHEAAAIYDGEDKRITLCPSSVKSMMDDTDEVVNTLSHECVHHQFNTSHVRDESFDLVVEAVVGIRAEIPNADPLKPMAKSLTNIPLINAVEASNNEIMAYVIGDKDVNIEAALDRLNYIERVYPPATSLYLFEKLYETVCDNKYMEFGLKMDLLEKVDGYVENARHHLNNGLKLTE